MVLARVEVSILWDFDVPTEEVALSCPFCGERFIVRRTGKEVEVTPPEVACPHADWWDGDCFQFHNVQIVFNYPELNFPLP